MSSENIQMVTVDNQGAEKEIYPITKTENIKDFMDKLKDLLYPVGSIYTSTTDTNPATLYGGVWERIKDTFLICAGDTYSAGSKGGSSTVTLNTNQIPAHTHTFTGSSATTGNQSTNHTHSVSITSGSAGAHTHTSAGSTTGGADGNAGHGLVQPGTYTNRVLVGGLTTPTSSNGAHTHSVSGNTGNQSANHTHAVTAKGTNSNTGGSQAHDNMPPYLAIYVWRRTA